MSLPKKSVHVRLDEEEHGMGTVLADLNHVDLAAYLSLLLRKQIRAEFYVVSMQAKQLERLGLTGKQREGRGS